MAHKALPVVVSEVVVVFSLVVVVGSVVDVVGHSKKILAFLSPCQGSE